MAEVYRAYHASLDRYVAIKVLHAFLADDPEFKDRFEREARNIARLKHPHIVQVYDFDYDQESDSYYMVMELIDGPTLKDRLFQLTDQGKQFTLTESLRIVREAGSALAYAHSQNMVHRDVKPGNLMLDRDDRIVLTDFGIAKIVTNAQFTATGGMVGTPAYMSPEQGLGEAGDERSDLYSLGVILYQLVAGRLPYDAESPLAVILKHLNDPIPRARDINPELPETVDHIIARLMAKEAAHRYQSAAELIADVERLEQGQEISLPRRATTDTPPSQLYDTLELKLAKGTPAPLPNNGQPVSPTLPRPPAPIQAPVAVEDTPAKRRSPWLLLVTALLLVILIGGYGLAVSQGVLPPVMALIASATPTESPVPTATIPPTETATPTPTDTTVPTSTDTATASPTPTESPTITLTPSITFTPTITLTPTPDITQTLIQLTVVNEQMTATTAACDFDYAIIEQNPADGDFFPTNSDYVREITLLNTGTCPWERNTSLTYVSGESFNAGPRIFIRDRVDVGEETVLLFEGRTSLINGRLSGVWELRTPGQIPIGVPLEISLVAFTR
jgi:serine/threonine-protein kinase